jgi:hypothetical protein
MNIAGIVGGLSVFPRYHFHLSDDEVVNIYLTNNNVCKRYFMCTAIVEVDLDKTKPWDVPCT